ncbi:MAG: hypothetical protein F4010_05220 [Cenarchaeum sp. SB0669_bin_11]|nr:hypothetical protein [Cenarchaeum sp. SB0669_bin_11]
MGSVISSTRGPKRGRGFKIWLYILVPGLTLLLGVLVFLFGEGVVNRTGGPNAEPRIQEGDRSNLADLPSVEGTERFHSAYSFTKGPFVHPKIIDDLVGYLSDTGDQVVAVNLLDSQDSNHYFGEILVEPQANPMTPSWPWVYTVEGEHGDNHLGDLRGKVFYAYQYLGSTRDGVDVLHTRDSGGGSAIFNRVVFVMTEADRGVDYPPLREVNSREGAVQPVVRERELIRLIGRISLGDRWMGTIEVVENDVVVRGRDLMERCEHGGVTMMEAVELKYFMEIDCKEGPPKNAPKARAYKAPAALTDSP